MASIKTLSLISVSDGHLILKNIDKFTSFDSNFVLFHFQNLDCSIMVLFYDFLES
jgi:hypothetical protein